VELERMSGRPFKENSGRLSCTLLIQFVHILAARRRLYETSLADPQIRIQFGATVLNEAA
jgi:hypothetical protein